MTVLVTGFEAFGPVRLNPSEAVLRLLPKAIEGHAVQTATLPVDTQAIGSRLQALYARDYDLVIHAGVARERSCFSLEQVAQNRLSFDLPDNAGRTVTGQRILQDCPPTLRTRLPIEPIHEAWSSLGITYQPSQDAGTYLCNQTFYLALQWLPAHVPVGFIHLPPDENMAPHGPHVPIAVQAQAVLAAVRASLGAQASA